MVCRQVILLSATMPVDVLEVTKRFMREPIRILVKKEELTLEGIRQFYIEVQEEVGVVMVALCNRADHYIFALWFLSSFFLLSSSFFPRLISAVGDWMSTILPHMVWP